MAYEKPSRCNACKAPVQFIIWDQTGKAMMFDPAPAATPVSPTPTRWAEYLDPRTGTPRARRLAKDDHLEPDEELLRPHYATCPQITRNDHDR